MEIYRQLVVLDPAHDAIGRDEPGNQRVIVPGIIEQEASIVQLLPCVVVLGLPYATRAHLAPGVVLLLAHQRTVCACCSPYTAQVVPMQVDERAALAVCRALRYYLPPEEVHGAGCGVIPHHLLFVHTAYVVGSGVAPRLLDASVVSVIGVILDCTLEADARRLVLGVPNEGALVAVDLLR